MRFLISSLIAVSLLSTSTAVAHQPVILLQSDTTAAKGPLLIDGTISFAVRASFTKTGQTQALRAQFKVGDQLALQYLIVDKKPENSLKSNQLPVVVITAPSGKKITMKINERTKFFEPYSQTNYFYLARFNGPAEEGIYKVSITSKAKSSITVAIGEKEIRGQVVRDYESLTKCPSAATSDASSGITQLRANALIGMSEAAAENCAKQLNWLYRIAERDEELFMLTKDYRINRVTVFVKVGLVTKVDVG